MKFILRNNRRLIIASFSVRYVQLAAVSEQWPWSVDNLILKITNNWAYKLQGFKGLRVGVFEMLVRRKHW